MNRPLPSFNEISLLKFKWFPDSLCSCLAEKHEKKTLETVQKQPQSYSIVYGALHCKVSNFIHFVAFGAWKALFSICSVVLSCLEVEAEAEVQSLKQLKLPSPVYITKASIVKALLIKLWTCVKLEKLAVNLVSKLKQNFSREKFRKLFFSAINRKSHKKENWRVGSWRSIKKP